MMPSNDSTVGGYGHDFCGGNVSAYRDIIALRAEENSEIFMLLF